MNTERPEHTSFVTRGVKPSELAVGDQILFRDGDSERLTGDVKELLQVGTEPWVRVVRAETLGCILKHAEYRLPVTAVVVGWRRLSPPEAQRYMEEIECQNPSR